MKGIVVQNDGKDAVILTDDGLFSEVKNRNYELGQTIDIKIKENKISRMIVGAASLAAALVICTVGGFAYYTPTDYVSLDVNPSVEYSINMFDRILDVKAVNDDGKEILSSLELNNKTIEDAIKETLDQLLEDGYLTNDPYGGVVITTSNDKPDEAEKLAEELEEDIQTYLDRHEGVIADVDAEAVTPERVQEAKELGVPPGKLNLVEKLQKSTGSAITLEDWLSKPVKEINKAIKENRESSKKIVKENGKENEKENPVKNIPSRPEKNEKGNQKTKTQNTSVTVNEPQANSNTGQNKQLDKEQEPQQSQSGQDEDVNSNESKEPPGQSEAEKEKVKDVKQQETENQGNSKEDNKSSNSSQSSKNNNSSKGNNKKSND